MAMQVEVGTALVSLANLSELTNEAKLQHAFAKPLSDAGSQPRELPLTPLLLEERGPFGNPLRPATMTPATARPRLTPRPFCREKSAETFAIVKPPVPVLKPSTAAPKPSVLAKSFEDTSVARGFTGNVPPLVDQTAVESKSSSDLVANVPFYSSPQANTVILFETGSSDRVRMTLTSDRNTVGVPRTLSALPAQEGKRPSSKSEMSSRRPEGTGIHRQLSLSSESRPGPWNPCRPLERGNTLTDTTEEKAKEEQKQLSSCVSPASEGQLRLKQRPVSAIFLESLKDRKHCTPDTSDEKPLEKPWVRKPRPLSMDLTAKFENRDLSVQRKACPFETKEKNLVTQSANVGYSRPAEMGLERETAGLGRADLSQCNLKTAVQATDSRGAKTVTDPQIQKPIPNEAASLCHGTPRDPGQVSAKDREYLWEPRRKSQDEQTERETEVVAVSGKSQERPSSTGQSVKERAVLDPKEICSENRVTATGMESRSLRGGEVKLLNFLETSASRAAPVNTEPLPASPEKECRILNIQQRIKELTAENTDAKPGNLRRSFRSRPLSSDLTKLFSSPAASSELRPERQAEPHRKPLSEMQEAPENEASPLSRPDRSEVRVPGPPWKPQQPLKTQHVDGHFEKESSVAKERQNVALQGEGPSSLADRSPKPPSVATTENPRLKTVRATLFEHSVQRHNVVVDHLGSKPVLQPTPELAGGQLGPCREPWLEKALESQTSAKKGSSKQAGVSLDAVKHGQVTSLKEDRAVAAWEKYTAKEKPEKPTQKHAEDSLKHQRIEPKYEILQTVGERVQSEAVAVAAEDKAVTLRSRRSLKERRRTEEGVSAVSWPRSVDLQECGWKEDGGSVSRTKDPGEAAVQTSSVKGRAVSHGQQVSHGQGSELHQSHVRQQQADARAPCFPSRDKGLGTADDTVSGLPSEAEKERPDKMLRGFPGSSGGPPGRTDSYEVRAQVGENMASAKAGEHRSPASPGGTSQWQKGGSKAAPPSMDTRTYGQEDSGVLGLRKTPSAPCAEEELGVSGRSVAGERFGQLDVEEGVRRSSRGVSTPKATERWRRKTLPHSAVRVEDAGAPAPETAKALGRRDSLQFHNSSIAKRNRESRCEAEPQEGSPAFPSCPNDSLRRPFSPSEPRADDFAAASQDTGGKENTFDPLQGKPASSAVENLLLSPNMSTSRRSHRQHNKRFPDTPGSLDRHRSKSWGEGGTSDLPRPGDARGESWRSLGRHLGDSQETGAGVAPPLQAELKPPSYMRSFPPNRERLGPQDGSSYGLGMSKGKGPDRYRSQVLDIDALMAEYKDNSKRERGPSEESRWSQWEKLTCRRNSADKMSSNYILNSPKGLDCSPRSPGQGIHAAEFRWPEHVSTSEQEKAESCSRESSPLKARDVALSTPPWGRLAADKAKYLLADPTGTRKKTFIVDEEHGESLVLRHQRAKYASGNVQLASSVRVDPEPRSGHAPRPSQGLPDGVLWKGTSLAHQAGVVRSEEDGCKTVHAGSLNKSKGGAEVGFPATDASRVNWNSSESGLANAPHDLRRSYSEKTRQARARGHLPSGPDVRDGFHQGSNPGRVNGWLSKQGAFQQDASSQEGKRDLEKEQQGHGSSGGRSPPCLPGHRRSRSFYRERRTDHWATDQLKECFGRPTAEAKDTDTLVQEADSQYGTWSDQRHSGNSFVPESPSSESNVASAQKQPPGSRLSSFSSQTDPASAADQLDSSRDQRSTSLDRSSTDVDSADGTEGPAPAGTSLDFSFLDHTPVLDSSALKTRVQLSKRRRQHRAPISHSLRRSTGGDPDPQLFSTEEVDGAWMFQDCTEVKSAKRDGSEEEEKLHPMERSPSSQPQRLPVFPGMDHSVLKAQLRKRQEMEGRGDGSPVQLAKSPRSPFQARALGGKVLPPGMEKEERSEEPSPQWLRELKSKKRQSQYENQV